MVKVYSIGQLSKKTAVTIRTLDYYDEIGLLKPSSKTEGGHRLYSDDDVMKLQRILALKYMGFSLEKIRAVLEETKSGSWQQSLKQQLDMVRQEQKHLKIIEQALIGVSYAIEMEGDIDWQMIFDIIHLFQDPNSAFAPYESYLNNEQMQMLLKINEKLSDDDIREWISSINEIKNNLNLDPASETARVLVENWTGQVQKMFGNDEELLGNLKDSLKNIQEGIVFYPLNKEIISFIEKVLILQFSQEEVIK